MDKAKMNPVYECDPEKNTLCPKYGCQDFCFHTAHKEYSKDGKAYDFDDLPSSREMRERKA